jgi:Transposase DDE domain
LIFAYYGPERLWRAIVATTDPASLPRETTWYLTTNLPQPGSARAAEMAGQTADLAELVQLYSLRTWVEQGYRQMKQELGWADFMVRSDRAIRRHWYLVCCAFSFCWRTWFAPPANADALPASPSEAALPPATPVGRGKMSQPPTTPFRTAPRPSWPMALRQVRGWLDPWTFLGRCWRAWSTAPPPPELQALVEWLAAGRALYLYLLL